MTDWDAQSIVLIIGALSTMVVTIIASIVAAVTSMRSNAKAVIAEQKTDNLIEKTAEIHAIANGNLSKVNESLKVANAEIAGLQTLVATLVESKREAASVAAVAAAKAEPKPQL